MVSSAHFYHQSWLTKHLAQSDDFLELGNVGPQTHITVGSRSSRGNMLNSFPTEDDAAREARKTIVVKSTVVQTYSEPKM